MRPRLAVNDACETDRFAHLDFAHRVDETVEVIKTLQTTFPRRHIYLVGHSAGAHVALLASERIPVAGIVNLGGGVDELGVVLPHIDPTLRSFVEDVRTHARGSDPLWGRTYRFWHQMMFNAVGASWRSTRHPVLVLHGEEDHESVPISLVRSAAASFANRPSTTFVFLPGAGHDLLTKEVWLRVNDWIAREDAHDVPRIGGAAQP